MASSTAKLFLEKISISAMSRVSIDYERELRKKKTEQEKRELERLQTLEKEILELKQSGEDVSSIRKKLKILAHVPIYSREISSIYSAYELYGTDLQPVGIDEDTHKRWCKYLERANLGENETIERLDSKEAVDNEILQKLKKQYLEEKEKLEKIDRNSLFSDRDKTYKYFVLLRVLKENALLENMVEEYYYFLLQRGQLLQLGEHNGR